MKKGNRRARTSRPRRDGLDHTPKTPVARMKLPHRRLEVFGIEVRPQALRKDKFRVSALPQHEVAQSLLAAGANQQIELGDRLRLGAVGAKQAPKLQRCGFFTLRQSSCRSNYCLAARVVNRQAEVQSRPLPRRS